MKKDYLPCIAIMLITTSLLSGCIREVIYTVDDMYASFPEAEILGASFYYQRNGQDVSGDEAGMISRNEDGTYHVKMRRRSPSSSPTAMFIGVNGSFEFSDFYKIVCTFPDDPAIKDKPYRVYVCGSRLQDGNTDADYPTASDLMGEAVFRNGVAIGTFTMTNEGINYLNPDPRGRPYTTVFLYLYFDKVTDPDDYYEFTLDYAGGARGKIPESVVTKAEVYRDGDAANKLEPVRENYTITDPDYGPLTKNFILARYNQRLDSLKLGDTVPIITANSLRIDLHVPNADAGREIEFEIRGVSLFSADNSSLITRDMLKTARVLAGTAGSDQTGIVTETSIFGSKPAAYCYTIKAKTVTYADMTGIKLAVGAGPFVNAGHFTCTINLPDKYVGEK
jgi:hypothetical protein